jgi:hypothetical protein
MLEAALTEVAWDELQADPAAVRSRPMLFVTLL